MISYKIGYDLTKLDMTKHLTSHVTLHLLDHGVDSSTALLHQSHQPYFQSACLAVPQWLFLLVTCLKKES
jgi:hypothetical protein